MVAKSKAEFSEPTYKNTTISNGQINDEKFAITLCNNHSKFFELF